MLTQQHKNAILLLNSRARGEFGANILLLGGSMAAITQNLFGRAMSAQAKAAGRADRRNRRKRGGREKNPKAAPSVTSWVSPDIQTPCRGNPGKRKRVVIFADSPRE